jgi:uncharacterized phage-associated protein
MVYLGRTGEPLISESFEAWMYGPVVPQLYKKMKIFGSYPVEDRFYNAESLDPKIDSIIVEVCDKLKAKRDNELVAMTHADGGGWSKNFHAGERGSVIEIEDILNEYRSRTARI